MRLPSAHPLLIPSLSSPSQSATTNNLWMQYDPNGASSFSSHQWNVGTNLDRAFASVDQDNQLPDRHVLGKFSHSQHWPSLMMPARLKVPAYSDPVNRWNFRKADSMRFCLLTGEFVKRLPPPDTTNIEKTYQEFCDSRLFTAMQCISRGRRKTMCYAGTKSTRPFSAPSSEPQRGKLINKSKFSCSRVYILLQLHQICPNQIAYWAKTYVTISSRVAYWITY